MAGYSARLPMNKDPNDGFQMLKTIPEVAKQNFKMLLLTEPGERVWDKNYGVGLKRFLFLFFHQISPSSPMGVYGKSPKCKIILWILLDRKKLFYEKTQLQKSRDTDSLIIRNIHMYLNICT